MFMEFSSFSLDDFFYFRSLRLRPTLAQLGVLRHARGTCCGFFCYMAGLPSLRRELRGYFRLSIAHITTTPRLVCRTGLESKGINVAFIDWKSSVRGRRGWKWFQAASSRSV
jgi:hypothetical protein